MIIEATEGAYWNMSGARGVKPADSSAYSTVLVRAPETFQNKTLWPEFHALRG